MECMHDYLECMNFHWIVVVATGLYIHLREICLIGLCFEVVKDPPFDPSYASLIFIFSVLCLLAEYRLWPRSLKEPPLQLLIIYEMLVSALVTDLATRIIWVPLMHITWCLTQESAKLLNKYGQLAGAASYLSTEVAATHAAFCIAVLTFLWMLDATETLDSILIDLWAKEDVAAIILRRQRRIHFAQPEVTDCFTYKLWQMDEEWEAGLSLSNLS